LSEQLHIRLSHERLPLVIIVAEFSVFGCFEDAGISEVIQPVCYNS